MVNKPVFTVRVAPRLAPLVASMSRPPLAARLFVTSRLPAVTPSVSVLRPVSVTVIPRTVVPPDTVIPPLSTLNPPVTNALPVTSTSPPLPSEAATDRPGLAMAVFPLATWMFTSDVRVLPSVNPPVTIKPLVETERLSAMIHPPSDTSRASASIPLAVTVSALLTRLLLPEEAHAYMSPTMVNPPVTMTSPAVTVIPTSAASKPLFDPPAVTVSLSLIVVPSSDTSTSPEDTTMPVVPAVVEIVRPPPMVTSPAVMVVPPVTS